MEEERLVVWGQLTHSWVVKDLYKHNYDNQWEKDYINVTC